MAITLTPQGDGYALRSPYDAGFVAAFKAAVPSQARRWDAAGKVWIVAPTHAAQVADLCAAFFNERPDIPALAPANAAPQVRVIRLEYLGQCKARDGGAITAMGYADGAWSIIAPESVLRRWFGAEQATHAAPLTYYQALGVAASATPDAIKAGYRRMARQWHPDACKEPNAHEMFLSIKTAYDLLSDPLRRRKYDAGLLFEARAGTAQRPAYAPDYYRAPLRCGLVLAEAVPSLGRWSLAKILGWDDITNDRGETMVASWNSDEERIETRWVLN